MDSIIVPRALYRHFKGDLYYVIGTAKTAAGEEKEVVVYHALYGDNEMYVRDIDDFFADVSQREDNTTGQKYRFVLFQHSSAAAEHARIKRIEELLERFRHKEKGQ